MGTTATTNLEQPQVIPSQGDLLGDLLNLDLGPPVNVPQVSSMQMGAVDLLGGGLDSLVSSMLFTFSPCEINGACAHLCKASITCACNAWVLKLPLLRSVIPRELKWCSCTNFQQVFPAVKRMLLRAVESSCQEINLFLKLFFCLWRKTEVVLKL